MADKKKRRAFKKQPTDGAGSIPKTAKAKPRPGGKSRGVSKEATPAVAPPVHPFAPDAYGRFPIVGIGASAGGLEACSQLLNGLPEQPGMAMVVVQHLAPKHHSILPDLLRTSSRMPVIQATDGIEVKIDHVYVIPPNVHLKIAAGRLWLMPRPEDRTQYMPIDYFFRTLAEYAQTKAIGIILSGTASDGAVGLREIKGVGGITIDQEPGSAKYDGMPRAAIATGFVDLVLAPKDMASELIHIGHHPLVRHLVPMRRGEEIGVLDDQFNRIFLLLRSATGVDFSHYKLPTIKRRLQRRMVLHKMTGIEAYIRFLHQNPNEIQSLYQDILIHVTRFFREPESFKVLAQKCFPQILEKRAGDATVRVWVPGCSTGEDAY